MLAELNTKTYNTFEGSIYFAQVKNWEVLEPNLIGLWRCEVARAFAKYSGLPAPSGKDC